MLPVHAETDTLVERFAPVLAFDRQQRGFPMDAQVFFEGMLTERRDEVAHTITWDSHEAAPGPLTSTVASSNSAIRSRSYRVRQNTDSSILNFGTVPTYYHVDDHPATGALRIVYYWFYGWQYPCNFIVGGLIADPGSHMGDWEQVMVTTNVDRTAVARVTFWQHGGWYTQWNHGKSKDGRVVVYVGKYAHGSYHYPRGGSNPLRYCYYFDDPRQPAGALPETPPARGVPSSYWWTHTGPLLDLDSDAQPWMAADRVGTSYPGTELKITNWRWGPDISTHLGGRWTAVGTHPTTDVIDWSMGTCYRKADVTGVSRNGCEQDSGRTGPFPAPAWVDNPAGGWPDWMDTPGLALTATSLPKGGSQPGTDVVVDVTVRNVGVDCAGLAGHPVKQNSQLCIMPPVQFGRDGMPYSPQPGRNATVHRTMLTADLPPSIEWSLGDPAPAGCAIAGDRLSCLFGSLQAARQRTIHLRGRTSSGSCPGTAVVTAEAGAAGAWPASVTATTQPLVRCPADKTSAEPVDWTSTVLLVVGAVLTGGLLLWGAWWWGRRGRRLSHA